MNPANARTFATRALIPVTAAAVCLGVTAPAMAHDGAAGTGAGAAAAQWVPPTLDQEKAWVTAWIDRSEAWLTAWGQKVQSSDAYTDQVKADFAQQIAAAISGLEAVKTAVANATTQDALASAVKEGFAAVNWPERPARTATDADEDQPADPAAILAAKKAHWADRIADIKALLTAKAAKVAANPNLTDAQKAAYAQQVSTALSELDALAAAIASATTLDELKAAIANNHVDWPDRLGFRTGDRHDGYVGRHRAPAQVPTRGDNTPTSTTFGRTSTTTRTVSVRTGSYGDRDGSRTGDRTAYRTGDSSFGGYRDGSRSGFGR